MGVSGCKVKDASCCPAMVPVDSERGRLCWNGMERRGSKSEDKMRRVSRERTGRQGKGKQQKIFVVCTQIK